MILLALLPTLGWASATDLAAAMDVPPGDVLSAALDAPPGSFAARSNLGAIRPQQGGTFAWLYTGQIGERPQSGTDLPGEDRAFLTLQLRPPASARSLQLDFAFLSAEYPEFVGSRYNDVLKIEVAGPGWKGDAARDKGGNPISINSVFFQVTGGDSLNGTGFEGGVGGSTGWLTATVPVQGGQPLTLRVYISDIGDAGYDSGVLLDKFRWSDAVTDSATLVQAQPTASTLDTSGLPATCYTGQPCAGVVRATGGSKLVIGEDNQAIAQGAPAGVSVSRTYPQPGTRRWTVHHLDAQGKVLAAVTHEIRVEQPLKLVAAPVLDFGAVPAGSPTPAPANCKELDLRGSQQLSAHTFRLDLQVPGGCQAEPRLRFRGKSGRYTYVTLPTEGYTLEELQTLCLAVPLCDGEVIDGAKLTITPSDPGLAAQQRVVQLKWKVEAKSWLGCNWWWIAALCGLAFAVWAFFGFVTPARFPREVAVSVAGSEKGLRRAAPQRLREIRGAGAGFYYDARLGIHSDGSISARTRGAVAFLRARRGVGLVLQGAGVEVMDRRTRQWVAPDDLAQGHAPLANTTYRCGEVWFTFEGL